MARRILFYTHALGGGGAEVVFQRLAAAFAAAGDDVIFAADYAGPTPLTDRPNLRHMLLGRGHAGSTRRLAALLRDFRPDASFSAVGGANLKHVVSALLAGRLRHCVLGYHGFAVAETKLLARLGYWGSPLLTRLAARTICVSDALLDDMRRRWHASARRSLRIYNPVVAKAALMMAPSTNGNDPPLIVACGRLVPGKRFDDLVAALAQVSPPVARLAILGEGPEREAILEAASHHGVAQRVTLPGFVGDPTPWYRRAACVAISSESESFGLTAAEALACGTPVVSTDCGGPREILDGGRYGRVVPVGDPAALAAAISTTLADPGPTAPLQDRARAFTIEAIHKAYADLADSLAR